MKFLLFLTHFIVLLFSAYFLFNFGVRWEIEPLVTINHFDCPMHLIHKFGGWRNREMIDCD